MSGIPKIGVSPIHTPDVRIWQITPPESLNIAEPVTVPMGFPVINMIMDEMTINAKVENEIA